MRIPRRARLMARIQQLSTKSSVVGKSPAQIPALRERLAIEPNWATKLVVGELSRDVFVDELYAELPGRQLRIRRYTPIVPTQAPRPVIVDFHGGGYVIGQPELKDWFNSQLAHRTDAIVVSVDYRLAPEHPFPAAYDDAIESYRWVVQNARGWDGDPERIVVMGDSAGGSLAAGVAIATSHQLAVPAPRAQVLLYPATDLETEYPSAIEQATAPFLSVEESDAYLDLYCSRADRSNSSISPINAADLSYVAPAVIVTAEYDPLRDQGVAYGAALTAAGVRNRTTTYPGTAHGFISTPGLYPAAIHALREIVDELTDLLAPEENPVPSHG
ncbi:alpha/beta hydrolase [Rhodococcus sp. IEGM 1366]|uniref:alpha/beta hydrolase n=1 Tax=Rhodococcus sp. IEGM 1366 TaxID=3082223 RepID=UPI002955248A|nr:alpha/beta hydrolase [Rhodococcus sp. IEGM 1366]MDV8070685.1 alpha/beta hydrolase [Rhodococcus sp. IEGM 1366]